ncbi:NAD(P)-dependent oxidoreductase [Chelativorans alearense]|uniref:NAD(P)-dependent oxidoreductase n=1 Tax=Chelativorans alearense TaxID=2681495 RepID=UPI0013D6212E|nr:DUF1932 domain-containing protein [Chelativorans alearense]
MRIAFIGFGEAARAFCDTLRSAGHAVDFSAYDIVDAAEMQEAMTMRDVRPASSVGDAVSDADWIISAVTADQSLAAAVSVAPYLVQGQVFIDINSVSPDRKAETAERIEAQSASYLDMAVMAPVHPEGHATPTLIAGTRAATMEPELSGLGFAFDIVGDRAGQATAVKMVRSLFVKGLEAITVECALAAAASGVYDRVIGSLERSYPQFDWTEHIAYVCERTLNHGKRRAAEMRESAATLDSLGLRGGLAREIAEIQDRMGALPATRLPEADIRAALRDTAAARGARLKS